MRLWILGISVSTWLPGTLNETQQAQHTQRRKFYMPKMFFCWDWCPPWNHYFVSSSSTAIMSLRGEWSNNKPTPQRRRGGIINWDLLQLSNCGSITKQAYTVTSHSSLFCSYAIKCSYAESLQSTLIKKSTFIIPIRLNANVSTVCTEHSKVNSLSSKLRKEEDRTWRSKLQKI